MKEKIFATNHYNLGNIMKKFLVLGMAVIVETHNTYIQITNEPTHVHIYTHTHAEFHEHSLMTHIHMHKYTIDT